MLLMLMKRLNVATMTANRCVLMLLVADMIAY